MNKEICKKCHNTITGHEVISNSGQLFLQICYELPRSLSTIGCCYKTIAGGVEYKDAINKQEFDDLELTDQECYYYVEHQLYDWNRKR